MFRYVHTNIIARDCDKLIAFYKEVFHCKSVGHRRDLKGPWADELTGIPNVHIVGEHLCMPGYGDDLPTLEIFSFNQAADTADVLINARGIGHLAFEVDDVEATLQALLKAGGSLVGKVVTADYPGKQGTLVYARDPEGNIVELQSWREKG